MRLLRLIVPAFIAGIGLLVIGTTPTSATPAMTKKEKKPCVACHTKNNSKELNDAGKYYKEKGTLDGFVPKK
jgi:hypothetical protein